MVKRTPAVTVGCLVVLLTSGVVTNAAAQCGADEVERVIKDFLVPFSNRNISEFIEYFADDATASRTCGMLYTPPEEAVSRASNGSRKQQFPGHNSRI